MAASSTLTKNGAGRDAATDTKADGPPAKKKKKLVLVVAVVLGLAAAGLVLPKMMRKTPSAKAMTLTAAVANGPIDSIDPVTVNLSDGHLLQVGVAVQLTTAADAKKVTAEQPKILDALITVFSGWTYPNLLGTAGHDQARAQLESRVQALFPPVGGVPQVAALYFTSFVMQ
ncbi:MAG TPA: flagellar basal body-associated FliL family protein [Acidimicrobiales bacterium]|nr:flagellar basal body-associated FliL family protein [Acidimicrobiales bacterium]